MAPARLAAISPLNLQVRGMKCASSHVGLISRPFKSAASPVNEALGIQIPLEMMDRRLAAAGSVDGHKMSMLQDLERGRSLEIDAVLTLVQERGGTAHLYQRFSIDRLTTRIASRSAPVAARATDH